MATARRSTRQSTAATPKYAESSSSDSPTATPKRKPAKPARRKRARDNDDADEADEASNKSSPRKKTAPPKSKSKSAPIPAPKPKPKPTAKPKPTTTTTPLTPSNSSNRDAQGNQQVYWLFKAEPIQRYENGAKSGEAFSIDDLAACTTPEPWSGVRNPQACNIMKEMRAGDLGFFYHSNAKPSGVVGLLRVVEEAKVDETAFEKGNAYFDPKGDREKPRWFCVGVEFVRKFVGVVDLHTIKSFADKGGPLENMQLVRNSRLSVCRVTKEEWDFVMELAEKKDEGDDKNTEHDGE